MNCWASKQKDMATNHIATVAEYENNIEHLKTNIQYGGLLQLNQHNILNMMSIIIEHKDVSAVHRRMYDEFLNFLEIYDAQYTDKYRDLIQYILHDMTDEVRNRLPIDNNGNPILLVRPMLERSYSHMSHLLHNIDEDPLYRLVMSIKHTMKNINDYENQYLRNQVNAINS
jgi:hypothetical protein